ncbi:MAG: hypothetical protein WBV64_10395, partial [Mycobacterium sp.]
MSSRDPRYHPPRPPSGDAHPGMANYPSDGGMPRRGQGSAQRPSANRWLPPLDEDSSPREH